MESQTVMCQVCREDVSVDGTVALRACGHRFCVGCIATFLDHRIRDGVAQLVCFYQETTGVCGVAIENADVEALVLPDVFVKYKRFALVQANAQARQCPFCGHTQVTTASRQEPRCACEQCGRTFCYWHGNAHADHETCDQYDRRVARADLRSQRKVKSISRPCPKCACPIERNGGCTHMVCNLCKAQFCWHCGAEWGFDPAVHYSLWSLESCDGTAEARGPFIEGSHEGWNRLGRVVHILLLVCVGWPLTIALCWVWIPYTVWKEECAIQRRARVLARCFAVTVMLVVAYGVAFAIVGTCYGVEWLVDKTHWVLEKLEKLFRVCCCRSMSRSSDETETTDLSDPLPVV